jgi:hypothetical protein
MTEMDAWYVFCGHRCESAQMREPTGSALQTLSAVTAGCIAAETHGRRAE